MGIEPTAQEMEEREEKKTILHKIKLQTNHYKCSAAICANVFPVLERSYGSYYSVFVSASLFVESFVSSSLFCMLARTLPLIGLCGDLIFGECVADYTLLPLIVLTLAHYIHIVFSQRKVERYTVMIGILLMAMFVLIWDIFLEYRKFVNTADLLRNMLFLQGILQGVFVFFSFYLVYAYLVLLSRKNLYLNIICTVLSVLSGVVVYLALQILKNRYTMLEHLISKHSTNPKKKIDWTK